MAKLNVHAEVVADVAARLDLREPNQVALETIAAEVSQYFDVDGREAPFEGVLDMATGVGKTYVMAATMEFMVAAHGVSDFVVIVPRNPILEKTKSNFTPGHAKSLLGAMSFDPVVITSENFDSPAMRAAMDDPERVKIYIFVVNSFLRPTAKSSRKVHRFHEGLGAQFYEHLQNIQRLVVFADEHHSYYSPAFSAAVRQLHPWVLLGLTATPHRATPLDEIIYRYPLAAAIADKYVKTPVIVGRKDDRSDSLTKLTDGIMLLRAKAQAIAAYPRPEGSPAVNPIMLVVAKDITDANDYGDILRSSEFFNGAYAGDAVLVIHSDAPDDAHEALAGVEDTDSPVRIIISVGMLKEGWDVKNVYVIASMRSSVSEILTEQTLGRGMRLPFGSYTDVEFLNTLEVIAHERYEQLLKKAGILNEAFIDYRTRAVLRVNAQGQQVVSRETTSAEVLPVIASSPEALAPIPDEDEPAPVVTAMADRQDQASKATLKLKRIIARSPHAPDIVIPVLRMAAVQSNFSLADITDDDAFTRLGRSLAADPEGELSRTLLGARVITGRDGIRRTQLVTVTGADRVKAAAMLFPEDELRQQLADIVLNSPSVPARKSQRAALQPLLDAFMEGLGDTAQAVLSANLERAGARLMRLVETEQRRFMTSPSFDEVVELKPFDPVRATDRDVSADRVTTFSKSIAYEGWKRALFSLAWFDSATERAAANMIDDDDYVSCWARLHTGDIPILWSSGGRNYNPDLLVIETDGTHWLVEVKMEKEMTSTEVLGKRDAARRWANHVSADPSVEHRWKYLLAAESDISTAKGSWRALKQLAV
jgi:type III restriction enzyme